MRVGGGPAKGSSFERAICLDMSKWISRGEKLDLFNRNVLSGGQFTVAAAKKLLHGNPGDLAASHPLSHRFLTHFMVECKHHADLHLEQLMYSSLRKTYLGPIVAKADEQARSTKRHYLIIAKQNRIGTLLFTNRGTACAILDSSIKLRGSAWGLHHHMLYSGELFVFFFDDFLTFVCPDTLMERIKKYET